MNRMYEELGWPLDLAVRASHGMRVLESTRWRHPEIGHRSPPNAHIPLLWSALGRAYLAFCPAPEREAINAVNGDFASESYFLITQVLKQDWGFPGFVESDFLGIHVGFVDPAETIKHGVKAAQAFTDIDMPGFVNFNDRVRMRPEDLKEAISSGVGNDPDFPPLTESDIDDKVRRMLRRIVEYDFINTPPQEDQAAIGAAATNSREVAIQGAREGIVLLENKGNFLPLNSDSIKKIAVIGRNAQGEPPTGGGSAAVPPSDDFISEIDGIESQAPGATVDFIADCVPDPGTAEWQTGLPAPEDEGLVGQYFDSSDLSGSPVATRVDQHLNFVSFNAGNVPVSNPSSFSGIWTGTMMPTISGDHVFKVNTSGLVQLYVNGQLILNSFQPETLVDANTPASAAPPFVPISGKINLQSGVAATIELGAINLGTARLFNLPLFSATGLRFSWASLQPPANLAEYGAVVLAVGGNEEYDSEAHDRSFRLPEFQDDLILNATKLNPNTIVVLHGSGGFDVQAWVDKVPALLHAWFPGQYGVQPLSEILFGKVNPSGKLPVTMEKRAEDNPAFATFPIDDPAALELEYSEGLFVGYRGYEKNRIEPQYPFGYGLSYTKFRYSHLDIDPKVVKDKGKKGKNKKKSSSNDDNHIHVSFTVTNMRKRAGYEKAGRRGDRAALCCPGKSVRGETAEGAQGLSEGLS
jgi:beta-glucosidase